MRVAIVVMLCSLLLAGCAKVVEEPAPIEVIYMPEVIKADKPVENNQTIEQNITVQTSEQNLSENFTEPVPLNVSVEPYVEPEFLTVGAQHKMLPALEKAVKASQCYQVTWENATEHLAPNRLEVKKELRFEYLGALLFKGWILTKLMRDWDILTSETTTVLVDNLSVTCLDERLNFSIDWEKTLSKR